MDTRVSRFGQELDQIFTRKSSLPTLPDLMIQVQRALANEQGGLSDLARVIERDPGLTARLLRVANSAVFNPGTEVTTIATAVARIGFKNARSLCMAVGVVKAFGGTGHGLDHARYWEHSAAVGLVAERLSQVSPRFASVDGAEAYVAGLLHDVGLLLLDQFFPEDFAKIRIETDDELTGIWHVERRHLGLDHGEIGGRLLQHWKLPEAVIGAVTHHHHAGEGPALAGPIGQLVWGAEALCSACGLELAAEGTAEVSPVDVLDRVGVPATEHQALLAEVGDIGDRARQFTG